MPPADLTMAPKVNRGCFSCGTVRGSRRGSTRGCSAQKLGNGIGVESDGAGLSQRAALKDRTGVHCDRCLRQNVVEESGTGSDRRGAADLPGLSQIRFTVRPLPRLNPWLPTDPHAHSQGGRHGP